MSEASTVLVSIVKRRRIAEVEKIRADPFGAVLRIEALEAEVAELRRRADDAAWDRAARDGSLMDGR